MKGSCCTATEFAAAIITMTALVSGCGGGGGGGKSGAETQATAPPPVSEWLIPVDFVFDGGPGKDGIPALTNPAFESAESIRTVNDNDLAIAIQQDGQVKIYPHDIMDYHEIVNDGPDDSPLTLSYCPLTGSAMAWRGTVSHADPTFGVSGLLFNSNLLLYDRETDSLWSQMYEQAVNGPRIREIPERLQVVEAKYGTLTTMFPDAMVLSRATGFIRDYADYPYDDYRENAGLFYPVTNSDNRMHPKTRVIGVRTGVGVDDTEETKVYQLGGFGSNTQVINDQVGEISVVVVGNTELDIAVIYDRRLEDGTILNFEPTEPGSATVMQDDEGNRWDVFGTAVSGPRAGEQLAATNSYTAYWFAWVAHFPGAFIHFNAGNL